MRSKKSSVLRAKHGSGRPIHRLHAPSHAVLARATRNSVCPHIEEARRIVNGKMTCTFFSINGEKVKVHNSCCSKKCYCAKQPIPQLAKS